MDTNFDKEAQKRIAEAIVIAGLATLAAEITRWGWNTLQARFFPKKKAPRKDKIKNEDN
jgi:hypothetical protein